MIGFNRCNKCKRQNEKGDGWKWTCDAFPEGIPYPFSGDPGRKNCSGNGIGYEEDPELAKIYDFIK